MDVIYQGAMQALAQGLLEGAPDIRLMLVMEDFSGATQEDAVNIDDFTTLDECDGAGYQQIDCGSVDFSYDATANEMRLTFDPDEFNAAMGTLGPGSRDNIGMLVKLRVDGTDANDIALAFTDSGGFPFNGVGTAVAYTPHVDGMLYIGAA